MSLHAFYCIQYCCLWINDVGVNASLQQYKYNGKELDRVAGLNTYDYGARQMQKHDPTWKKTIDELKEHVKNILNELR